MATGRMVTCEHAATPSKQAPAKSSATSLATSFSACQRAIERTGDDMDFDLNEMQQQFKTAARELFAQECPPEAVRAMIESGEPYSEPLWQKLVEQGWTGLIFDEEVGGLGLGCIEMAVAFEEMGRALVPGAFLSSVALAGSLIARAGNEAQRNQYLKAICEGEAKATVALLEAHGDWNADAVQLTASETASGLT